MGGGAAGGVTLLVKRSFSLAGHRTSVALEPVFWEVLEGVAKGSGASLLGLVAGVDAGRVAGESLASALRVRALEGVREASKEGLLF